MIKYIFILLFIWVSTFTFSFGQPILKTLMKLPDTGQNVSYTTSYGEDNDFNINVPYFTINGDGSVSDTVTGLMWQQADGGEMTFENAVIFCDTLTIGGFSDWRLPSAHEAFSILNFQFANPALNNLVFTTTAAEYWWTNTRQVNDSTKIWVTNAGGGIGNHPKSETISAGGIKRFHVRAVRENFIPVSVANHFTDNGNGTITDNLTELIWQKNPFTDSLTWEQSLAYADSLTLNNDTDWRIPNVKELQSINIESLTNPSLDQNYFSVTSANKYWTSTTLPNQTLKAWYLDTQFGITTYDAKTFKHYFICVRGPLALSTDVSNIILENSNMIAYPNPFTSFINLTNVASNQFSQLFNKMGQLIYSGNSIEKKDFSSLPNGIYFLKVYSKKSISFILNKE